MEDPGQVALVRYLGSRRAPFEINLGQSRLWAGVSPPDYERKQERVPARQRWLPIEEAEKYNKLPGFTIVRRGTARPRPIVEKEKSNDVPPPVAGAVSLDVLLKAAAATREVAQAIVEEAKEKPELAPWIMSLSGMVHRRGCFREPKTILADFWSLDDASQHSRFKKFHANCVEG